MEGDLYPHQLEAVEKLRSGRILCGGVGTGKSRTAVAYYMKNEAPKDVYVITTAKKRDTLDWQKEFSRFGVGQTMDSTIAGVLHIDSWNNIGRYDKIDGCFFIFDEQRLVGSGTWTKAFISLSRRNDWILLSATPGDTWLDYIPVFVANGFYPNRTAFKRQHVIYAPYTKFPKVDRYVDVGTLVKHRNELLVHMPYQRSTVRHTHIVDVSYDVALFEMAVKKRWHVYENRPLLQVSELFSVVRKVVSTHPSRLEKIRELAAIHAKLIVFYNFDYELEILRTLKEYRWTSTCQDQITNGLQTSLLGWSNSSRLESKPHTSLKNVSVENDSNLQLNTTHIAEWNGHKHDPIPDTDRWIYLVQYTAGSEGWNCTDTDAMVFYSLTYSYKQFEQAKGRIDRLNTPFRDLHYYLLISKNYMDSSVAKALAHKKNFNERSFIKDSLG